MRNRFGVHCADALGRAYVSGLLGNDTTARAMLDYGREFARAYKYRFGVGPVRCALGGRTGGVAEDVERALQSARWLNHGIAAIEARGREVRAAFDELVIADNADSGPDWLDRILSDRASTHDFSKLVCALVGLEAVLHG